MSGPEFTLMTEYLDSWDSKKLNGSIDILGNDERATKELLNWLIVKKNHVIEKYKIIKGYFKAEDWKIIKEPFGEYPEHSLQYQVQTLAKDLKSILSGLRKDLQKFLLDTEKEATNDAIKSLEVTIEKKLERKRKRDETGNKTGPNKKSKGTTNTNQPEPTFSVVKNETERVLSLKEEKDKLENDIKDLETMKNRAYAEIQNNKAKEASIDESIKKKGKDLEDLTTAVNKLKKEFDLKTESLQTLSTKEDAIKNSLQEKNKEMELLESGIKTLEEEHKRKKDSVDALTKQEAIKYQSIKVRDDELQQLEEDHNLKTNSVEALKIQEIIITGTIQEKTVHLAELEDTIGTIEQTKAINSELQTKVSELKLSNAAYKEDYKTLYHDKKKFMRSIRKLMIKEKDTTKNLRKPGTDPIKRVGTSHTQSKNPNPVRSKQQKTEESGEDLMSLTDDSMNDSLSLQIKT